METPKPMPGTWTLTAPNGRTWQAESPLHCCGAEQRERVPREVAMKRVLDLADEPTDEEKRLAEECAKSERRALAFGDILHHHILAMRAAVIAGHLEGHAQGLQWIVNTLEGPGHLPDLDEARALGGAQALFDKETAEQDAFRLAHPAP